jgi:hypothetical protein
MCWLYTGSGLISILHSPSPSSTIPHKLGDLPRYPRSVSRHLAQWRHRNAPLIRTNRRSLVRFRGWTVRSGAFVCGVCECVRMNCCFCRSYWRILEYNSCYCVETFKDYITLFTVYVWISRFVETFHGAQVLSTWMSQDLVSICACRNVH